MNIELIKSELEKLNLLLSAWSEEQSISPIERDIALDYLKRLYDQIRFDEAAAPAVPIMPVVAAEPSEQTEQQEGQEEEKDVEVELIFADDEDLPQFGLLNELLSTEETKAEAEITPAAETETEVAPETEAEAEVEVVPEPIAEPEPEPEPEIVPEIVPVVELTPEPDPIPEPTPAPEPAPTPEPAHAPSSGSLFGEEEVVLRRPRSKHQRMMSIYNDSEPRPEKVVDISKIFDLDMDDDGPTEITVEPAPQPKPQPVPAPQPRPVAEPKAEPTTLADAIAPAAPTLADTIAAPAALADEMHHTPIRSLREGIGLNDKFLMIRDLFDGDGEAYEEAITALDALPTLDDCMIHIIENYAWNPDSEGSKFIMQLLDRKLS